MSNPEKQQNHDIITMHTPEGLTANVNRVGAFLESLKAPDGTELLFPRQTVNGKDRGGIPVCAPVFGPGDKVGLNQHGFARNLEWEYDDEASNAQSLQLYLAHPAKIDASTPKEYEGCQMELAIDLQSRGDSSSVVIKLTVANMGEDPFVLTPGFHPYFPADKSKAVEVQQDDEKSLTYLDSALLNAQVLPYQDSEKTTFSSSGNRITINHPNLKTGVIWSDNADKYFCVEPTVSGFATEEGADESLLRTIEPRAYNTYSMRIDWEPLG